MNNILIIGCGSIGALKDDKYDSKNSKNILTLAHAFYNNPNTNELIFYDIDSMKSKQAAIKWNGKYYTNLYDAIVDTHPEIIVVSVPTEYHHPAMLDIFNIITETEYKSKLILCEKPFTDNLAKAAQLEFLFSSLKIPIMVDYSRRFDHRITCLRERLLNNQPIYHATLTYARGFKRDASHGIDLFNYFFGTFLEGKILNDKEAIMDFSENDPTYAAYLSYEYCPHVFLRPIDGRDYDIFDIDIYCKGQRFNFVDHGKLMNTYIARPEGTYGDYNSIYHIPIGTNETNLTSSLSLLVENAYDYISTGSSLKCTSKDALKVHRVFKDLGV